MTFPVDDACGVPWRGFLVRRSRSKNNAPQAYACRRALKAPLHLTHQHDLVTIR